MLHVRGGTSTGVVLSTGHLPTEPRLRDELLRLLMGARPGALATRQISGLGRGHPTSNKVFLVEKADGDGADIESTLAQLAADKTDIDWRVSCGNLTAALPLFALDQGLVEPEDPITRIRIFNTNTGGRMHASVRTPGGRLPIPADTEIPGVAGAFPGVELSWLEPGGQITGALLPTGRPIDVLDGPELEGLEVSCVDVAVPMVIVNAVDLGKTADEGPLQLESDVDFMARLGKIRRAAGLAMGLRDRDGRPLTGDEIEASETVPKICIIAPGPPSPPDCAGEDEEPSSHLKVRYFTPQSAHPSLAVSGGSCLAAAALIPGSLAHRISRGAPSLSARESEHLVRMAHPAGVLTARVRAQLRFGIAEIHQVGYTRSAQILIRGYVPLYGASEDLVQSIHTISTSRA